MTEGTSETVSVSAKDVQRLRQAASVGMMDAKTALTEAGGDFDRAFQLLRERGLPPRPSAPTAPHPRVRLAHTCTARRDGSPLAPWSSSPLRPTSSPRAMSSIEAADEIAKHISWANPNWLRAEDVPEERLEEARRSRHPPSRERGEARERHTPDRRGEDQAVRPPERPVRAGIHQPEGLRGNGRGDGHPAWHPDGGEHVGHTYRPSCGRGGLSLDRANRRRVVLKLSGESFADPELGYGIDPKSVHRVAGEIIAAHGEGAEIAVVVGGGNIFRGVSARLGDGPGQR